MHILSLSEGLGFNTDVFETNVLNLAVVLYVVVNNLGETFSGVLDTRRERIVQSLARADEKYNAAQEALQKAQQRLEDAKQRAASIRTDGTTTVQQVVALVGQKASDELARLEEMKNATFSLAEQKATRQVQTQLVTLALAKAETKIASRLSNQSTRKAFVDLQIKTFLTYS
jgi:F-type H+-transporting ATPase subunit b